MTVAELGVRMSSAEFSDWLEYARLEPFGPLADGATAAVVANALASFSKKRGDDITASEALRLFAFDPPTPEERRQAQVNAGLAALLGLGAGRPRTVQRKPRE